MESNVRKIPISREITFQNSRMSLKKGRVNHNFLFAEQIIRERLYSFTGHLIANYSVWEEYDFDYVSFVFLNLEPVRNQMADRAKEWIVQLLLTLNHFDVASLLNLQNQHFFNELRMQISYYLNQLQIWSKEDYMQLSSLFRNILKNGSTGQDVTAAQKISNQLDQIIQSTSRKDIGYTAGNKEQLKEKWIERYKKNVLKKYNKEYVEKYEEDYLKEHKNENIISYKKEIRNKNKDKYKEKFKKKYIENIIKKYNVKNSNRTIEGQTIKVMNCLSKPFYHMMKQTSSIQRNLNYREIWKNSTDYRNKINIQKQKQLFAEYWNRMSLEEQEVVLQFIEAYREDTIPQYKNADTAEWVRFVNSVKTEVLRARFLKLIEETNKEELQTEMIQLLEKNNQLNKIAESHHMLSISFDSVSDVMNRQNRYRQLSDLLMQLSAKEWVLLLTELDIKNESSLLKVIYDFFSRVSIIEEKWNVQSKPAILNKDIQLISRKSQLLDCIELLEKEEELQAVITFMTGTANLAKQAETFGLAGKESNVSEKSMEEFSLLKHNLKECISYLELEEWKELYNQMEIKINYSSRNESILNQATEKKNNFQLQFHELLEYAKRIKKEEDMKIAKTRNEFLEQVENIMETEQLQTLHHQITAYSSFGKQEIQFHLSTDGQMEPGIRQENLILLKKDLRRYVSSLDLESWNSLHQQIRTGYINIITTEHISELKNNFLNLLEKIKSSEIEEKIVCLLHDNNSILNYNLRKRQLIHVLEELNVSEWKILLSEMKNTDKIEVRDIYQMIQANNMQNNYTILKEPEQSENTLLNHFLKHIELSEKHQEYRGRNLDADNLDIINFFSNYVSVDKNLISSYQKEFVNSVTEIETAEELNAILTLLEQKEFSTEQEELFERLEKGKVESVMTKEELELFKQDLKKFIKDMNLESLEHALYQIMIQSESLLSEVRKDFFERINYNADMTLSVSEIIKLNKNQILSCREELANCITKIKTAAELNVVFTLLGQKEFLSRQAELFGLTEDGKAVSVSDPIERKLVKQRLKKYINDMDSGSWNYLYHQLVIQRNPLLYEVRKVFFESINNKADVTIPSNKIFDLNENHILGIREDFLNSITEIEKADEFSAVLTFLKQSKSLAGQAKLFKLTKNQQDVSRVNETNLMMLKESLKKIIRELDRSEWVELYHQLEIQKKNANKPERITKAENRINAKHITKAEDRINKEQIIKEVDRISTEQITMTDNKIVTDNIVKKETSRNKELENIMNLKERLLIFLRKEKDKTKQEEIFQLFYQNKRLNSIIAKHEMLSHMVHKTTDTETIEGIKYDETGIENRIKIDGSEWKRERYIQQKVQLINLVKRLNVPEWESLLTEMQRHNKKEIQKLYQKIQDSNLYKNNIHKNPEQKNFYLKEQTQRKTAVQEESGISDIINNFFQKIVEYKKEYKQELQSQTKEVRNLSYKVKLLDCIEATESPHQLHAMITLLTQNTKISDQAEEFGLTTFGKKEDFVLLKHDLKEFISYLDLEQWKTVYRQMEMEKNKLSGQAQKQNTREIEEIKTNFYKYFNIISLSYHNNKSEDEYIPIEQSPFVLRQEKGFLLTAANDISKKVHAEINKPEIRKHFESEEPQYQTAQLVMSRPQMRGSVLQPEAVPDIRNQQIESKIKEQIGDIQFISSSNSTDTVKTGYLKQLETLTKQLEIHQKELEQIRTAQSKLIQTASTNHIVKNVIKQMEGQLKAEKFRRGLL